MRGIAPLAGLLMLLSACTTEEPDALSAAEVFGDVGGAKADGIGIQAELGGRYRQVIEPGSGPDVWNLENLMGLTVHLESGQTMVAVLRVTDGKLPQPRLDLVSYSEGAPAVLASNREWQALIPMASLDAALVIFTADKTDLYALVARDAMNEGNGSIQVDLLELGAEPAIDLTVTNAALRELQDRLRGLELELQQDTQILGLPEQPVDLFAEQVVFETGDGELGIDALRLSELAQAAGNGQPLKAVQAGRVLVDAVNATRQALFSAIVMANDLEAGAGMEQHVAELCAELWHELRAPEHALP